MCFEWLQSTKKITDAHFLKEANLIAKTIKKVSPKKIIVKSENLMYPLSPNIQKKFDDIILPAYIDVNLEKLAFIMPQGLFEKLSIEQTIDISKQKHTFDTKFFSDEIFALEWLS